MQDIHADFSFALLRIIVGFIACCGISALSYYLSIIAFFRSFGGSWFSGGKPSPFGFVFVALSYILIVFPFVLFPSAAYYLWADFKSVVPFTIPAFNCVLLFALFPVFFVLGWRKKERIKTHRRTWRPQNGRYIKHFPSGELSEVSNWKDGNIHGEYISYCENGKARIQGFYKNGRPFGVRIEQDCSYDQKKTIFYGAGGIPVGSNRYYNGILMEEYFSEDRTRMYRHYFGNGKLSTESIINFEIDSKGHEHIIKTTARNYHHETGDLIREDVQEFSRNK